MLNVGDMTPDVLGVDQNGNIIKRSDFPGKKIALYFYPKDNTPGCTAEACSLRDRNSDLAAQGYQVIGVSPDSTASHQKFIDKHSLPFPLVSDPEHALAEQFGAWGEKTMCGRKSVGILRTTYIISPDGVIEKIFGPKQIKTKIHADQILD